ncbi:MAG: LysE family translocator [Pseudomonadota bacterium]
MQEYSFLIAIAGVLIAGAMSPGPSFFVVAQNALSKSRADGIATAVGTALGVTIFALLAGLGVTTLIQEVPIVYLVFKIVGGAYLLWLAIKIWQGAPEPLSKIETDTAAVSGLWRCFLKGLAVQTSNPKTAIVIAGIFAAFVPASPPAYTVLLVALIAFIIDFSWYALVAIALSNSKSKQAYTSAKTVFDRCAAIFLGLVGVRLILSEA